LTLLTGFIRGLDGWDIYDPAEFYTRLKGTIFRFQGIHSLNLLIDEKNEQRSSEINSGLNLRHSNSNKFQVIPNANKISWKMDQGLGVKKIWTTGGATLKLSINLQSRRDRAFFSTASLCL